MLCHSMVLIVSYCMVLLALLYMCVYFRTR